MHNSLLQTCTLVIKDRFTHRVERSRALACLAVALAILMAPVSGVAGYQEGLRFVKKSSWDQAIQEFLPLANEGHAASQFSLGLIYQRGHGVDRDAKKAREYYLQAAKQRYWPAYNNLAQMYLDGDGVKQNRATSFKLFKKAATEHAQARNNLARMYLNGWGTPRDVQKALETYQLAGDTGYIAGYYNMGKIYERGEYIPRDIKTAIKWYAVAAEKNHKPSAQRLEALGASTGQDSIDSLELEIPK